MLQKPKFRVLLIPEDCDLAYPLIQELRPHVSRERFEHLAQEAARRDQYQLLALIEGGRCVAAMGYRTLYDLVHGKHLYIDDLCVTKEHQGQGLGAILLKEADRVARERDCESLRLCTGIDNEAARRFCEREGWAFRSVVYKRRLGSDL